MPEVLYGILGVILALALLCGGAVAGWKLNDMYREKTKKAVQKELTATEKQKAKEEAEAFATMMNYNADVAYGMKPIREERFEE